MKYYIVLVERLFKTAYFMLFLMVWTLSLSTSLSTSIIIRLSFDYFG